MITPEEIKRQVERKYLSFLRATLRNEPFFPLQIRFRKVKTTDDYRRIKAGVTRLLAGAKENLGYGYTVVLQDHNTRQYGTQSLPGQIFFAGAEDYLKFIQKQAEVAAFKENVALIREALPQLEAWLDQNPKKVIQFAASWPELLQVCHYFLAHPKPNLYVRELPLTVHTKFVETHTGILSELLSLILPSEAVRETESRFESRFFLRYDEPLIRLRVLDEALKAAYTLPFTDFSLPVSALASLSWSGHRFLISENKMPFLTLPPLRDSFALFGGGFQVDLLSQVPWLGQCPLFYWGDLDAQGFQILSRLRAHFPQTISFCMDEATLTAFEAFIGPGTPCSETDLPHLTPAEQRLFAYLAGQTLRLEQEHIRQAYVVARLAQLEGR